VCRKEVSVLEWNRTEAVSHRDRIDQRVPFKIQYGIWEILAAKTGFKEFHWARTVDGKW